MEQAEAGEVQALPRALSTGQQRHLLGRYLRSGDHSRLGIALQLPQVYGDRQGGRAQDCQAPQDSWPSTHPFPPTPLLHSPGPHALATLVLTLEQGVQQVLVDMAGAGVMDKEAWTKANP